MAVTSEPPWLNAASGIAARNGTTSHTISFGFTAAAGSLLVVEAFGGVTHTEASGTWTERLQPVNSGELSVFTRTASGGETSVTLNHNGSNYPIAYTVREYPAGSAYVGTGLGLQDSSETFPALSGLPGTEVVVHAARGRTATSGSETGASTAWDSPQVEDADLFTALATTDGLHFTSGHQINVTATSFTATATTTYTGTWSTPDRERVTYAIDAVAVPSGVAASGVARAASVARGTAAKVVAVTGRCLAVASIVAAARKAMSAVGRPVAAPAGTVTAKHVGVAAGRQVAAPAATAAVVKRQAATGRTTAATTAVMSGSSRAVTGRCTTSAHTAAVTARRTAVTGTTSAAPAGRAGAAHRSAVTAASCTAATLRTAALKRAPATGRVTGLMSAVGVAGQAGSTRPAAGRCVAAATGRCRTSQRTRRPFTGVTSRPFTGITYRP